MAYAGGGPKTRRAGVPAFVMVCQKPEEHLNRRTYEQFLAVLFTQGIRLHFGHKLKVQACLFFAQHAIY